VRQEYYKRVLLVLCWSSISHYQNLLEILFGEVDFAVIGHDFTHQEAKIWDSIVEFLRFLVFCKPGLKLDHKSPE
jgi:hypothetical protein